ncbi:recombinase family protein [Vibrio parahaemolyticus]
MIGAEKLKTELFEYDKTKFNGICVPYARFSTKGQSKVGKKSLERQLSKAREYAKRNNLYINEDLIFTDKGVSGYSNQGDLSKAFKKGQMATMLLLLEDVPPLERENVYITFHNFDRFSRMSPDAAQAHFNKILNRGFKIVTTIDNQLYDRRDKGMSNMLISIIKMTTAWQESLNKSIYIKDALSRKKKVIEYLYTHPTQKGKHKHIGIVQPSIPRWIDQENVTYEYVAADGSKRVDTFKKFSLNKRKAAVVRQIFELKIAGLGYTRICQKLNNDGVEVFDQGKFKKAKKWHSYAVQNIITSDKVLGNIVLMEMVAEEYHCKETDEIKTKKVKQEVTSRLENYYPAVVDEETFRLANVLKFQEKKGKPLGRIGERTNIFSTFMSCYCGASLQYSRSQINKKSKNAPPIYREQLRCTNALVKNGCFDDYINYVELEQAFFKYVNHIDFREICVVGDKSLEAEISNLQSEIKALNDEKKALSKKNSGLEKTFESAISQGLNADYVLVALNDVKKSSELIETKINDLKVKISKLKVSIDSKESEYLDIVEYSKQIKNSSTETKIMMRKKLNEFLHSKIKWMEICSSKNSKFVILCFHDEVIRTFAYTDNYANDLMFNTIKLTYEVDDSHLNYELFLIYIDQIKRSLRGETEVVTNADLINALQRLKRQFYESKGVVNV